MKKVIYLIVVATTIFNSCKKQDQAKTTLGDQTNVKNIKNIRSTFINGIQCFSTEEQFKSEVLSLQQLGESELEAYNASQNNFTSLYQQYKIMDANSEKGESPSASYAQEQYTIVNIQDDVFASIVNKDGYLICNNRIYKYSPNYFQYATYNEATIVSNINWSIIPQNSYKTHNYGNEEFASFTPNSKFSTEDDNKVTWATSNGRQVRSVHTVWCSFYGLYSSIGAKVKMERKGLLGWVNINHNSANNNSTSPVRILHMNFSTSVQTGNGSGTTVTVIPASSGNLFFWTTATFTRNKSTTNQNVNQAVGCQAFIFGQVIQHQVNAFTSNVVITRNGQTWNSTWVN